MTLVSFRISGRCLLASTVVMAACYDGAPARSPFEDPSSSGDTGGDGSPTGGADTDDPTPTGGDDEVDVPLQGLHRLNRLEYDNTVRDLLGTTLRPAAAFGPDPEANGFDNQAEQLQISSALIDAYDVAAREVLANALDTTPVFLAEFEGDALAVTGGYPVGSLWALSGNALSVSVTLPSDMEVDIVLTAGGAVVGSAPAPTALLRIDGVARPEFAVQGSAAAREQRVETLVLTTGQHTIDVVPTNHINEAAANISNNVFVESVRVGSVEVGNGPGHDRVYVCEPQGDDDANCVEQIVRTFSSRAWRRPVRDGEALALMGLWEDVRDAGESSDEALRLVLRAVMMSPKFFARMRTDRDEDGDGWLDDYVLASRLSYFLWSSMPDDRLFDMASQGRLSTDEGLSEAVDFMLDDPKSSALLDGFAEQWLSTRHLGSYVPSPDVYPGYDDAVHDAMVEESKRFFGDFLNNGAPVADLLEPDFAYRNDRLAAHYGLPTVGSDAMTRVPVGPGERRGLMTLGAWMTATSGADHSSPIRRGQWVTDRVMCVSPPPPPPGLEFEPPELGGDEPVRDVLERHRSDPGCASCHTLLDVVGIGFEEYDGVAKPVPDPNVDNLGELPDGSTFAGAEAFAARFADDPVFVACVTDKLFTYAVGRSIDLDYDRAALDELSVDAAQAGHDLRQLIDALVHMPSFRSPAPL